MVVQPKLWYVSDKIGDCDQCTLVVLQYLKTTYQLNSTIAKNTAIVNEGYFGLKLQQLITKCNMNKRVGCRPNDILFLYKVQLQMARLWIGLAWYLQ